MSGPLSPDPLMLVGLAYSLQLRSAMSRRARSVAAACCRVAADLPDQPDRCAGRQHRQVPPRRSFVAELPRPLPDLDEVLLVGLTTLGAIVLRRLRRSDRAVPDVADRVAALVCALDYSSRSRQRSRSWPGSTRALCKRWTTTLVHLSSSDPIDPGRRCPTTTASIHL